MGKHIQLSIADPCHENWDEMTKAEQGRFCASCQKQVIDFTSVNDSQLVAFFKKPANGSVCGRFYQDQLDRSMEIPKKRIPWIKYFFHFVLPAFLLSAKVSAQGRSKKPKPETTVAPQTMMLGEVYFPETKDATIEQLDIQGRVVNEEGIPVPFATVIIKGTTTGTAADSTGLFRIRGVVFDKNKAMVLAASSVGYDPKEIVVARLSELTKDITIQLSKQTMQEVVVIGYGTIKGRVMMGGIGVSVKEKWIGDIETITTPEEKPAMIKVYPNPVSSGSTINIGCEKLEEGYYTLRLFNQSGQQLQNQQIWIDNEARIMNLQLPAVAAGHYILTLTNKESGKKFTEKIIVQ